MWCPRHAESFPDGMISICSAWAITVRVKTADISTGKISVKRTWKKDEETYEKWENSNTCNRIEL